MASSSNRRVRKRLLIDGKVQGALLLRSVFYWAYCLLTITFLVICWRVLTGPPQLFRMHAAEMWSQFGPALVASVLLLPLVIMDVMRLSNRFAGPVYRLRVSMRQLAAGENVRPIHFREGDYWQSLADDFNTVASRLQQYETQARQSAESPEQQPVEAGV